jgi:hypothetical protein
VSLAGKTALGDTFPRITSDLFGECHRSRIHLTTQSTSLLFFIQPRLYASYEASDVTCRAHIPHQPWHCYVPAANSWHFPHFRICHPRTPQRLWSVAPTHEMALGRSPTPMPTWAGLHVILLGFPLQRLAEWLKTESSEGLDAHPDSHIIPFRTIRWIKALLGWV